jgi:hypothetical protein
MSLFDKCVYHLLNPIGDFNVTFNSYNNDINKIDSIINLAKNILTYNGDRKKILTKEDVIKCLPKNSKFLIWDIFIHLDKKEFLNCSKLLNNYLLTDSPSAVANSLFFVLLRRYKLIYLIKNLLNNNVGNKECSQKIKELKKINKESEEKQIYSDYEINKILYDEKLLSTYSEIELLKILKGIYELGMKIRYCSEDIDYINSLHSIFMLICFNEIDKNLEKIRSIYND